ncbi:hypothetical protein VHEMI04023 [[Torrubiella] hemipterigena]|uniref:Zn(2)-C6 fungal-type domain-containing protein n=1 Tax=[Torrubiella] hemipterigena TaxID=1531966 RepID=A0A0A1TF72_9HYPO|nr:hypothetical protein VHEMI04023 [[Torrubiella] hemipterigena]
MNTTSTILVDNRAVGPSIAKQSTKRRSRGGCLTCKQKHVKCDESRPHCLRCDQLGVPCGGYANQFTWSYKHQNTPHGRKRRPSSSHASQTSHTSQSTDYSPKSPVDGGETLSSISHQATSSATTTTAVAAPNNLGCPDLQASTAEYSWDQTVESLNALLDLDQACWLPSPQPQSTPEMRCLTLPATVRGGPEATDKLIAFWFDQVCPIWSAFDSTLNLNRKIAMDLMHHSSTVFSTLQSMSASFLSSQLPQIKRPYAIGLLKSATLSIEAEVASLRARTVLSDVPTGLLFSLFCLGTTMCWLDARRLGLPFLKEAKGLLRRVSLQQHSDGSNQHNMMAFFKKGLLYWEMLLSFVDDYNLPGDNDDIYSSSNSSDEIRPLLPPTHNTDLLLHPWTGISTKPARLFALSVRLCRAHRRRIAKPTSNEVAYSAAAQEMNEAVQLEADLLALDLAAFARINQQTGDERTPWVHLVDVAEAYQLSSLLQLYLTFPDLAARRHSLDSGSGLLEDGTTCEERTIRLALELCRLLERIPCESGSRVIQPMLYICASAGLCYPTSRDQSIMDRGDNLVTPTATFGATDMLRYIDQMDAEEYKSQDVGQPSISEMAVDVGSARIFIMRRLDSLECTLQPRPIAVAKQLVKAIWASYDHGKRCKGGHWLDVMEAQGLRSLFG